MRKDHPNFFPASLILFYLLLFSAGYSFAGEPPDSESGYRWSSGAGFEVNSRYVWRGLASSDGPVFQPSVWCGFSPLTASIWGNYVLGNELNQGQFDEIDYSLQLDHSFGDFDFTGILYYYNYLHQSDAPATSEAEFTITYPLSSVNLLFINSFDIGEYKGAYFGSLGIGNTLQFLNNQISHEISIGWSSSKFSEAYVGLTKSMVLFFNYNASAQFELYSVTFGPHFSFCYYPDNTLRNFLNKSYLTVIGISFTRELVPCK